MEMEFCDIWENQDDPIVSDNGGGLVIHYPGGLMILLTHLHVEKDLVKQVLIALTGRKKTSILKSTT